MLNRTRLIFSVLIILLVSMPAFAATIRVHINEVHAVGVNNATELKSTLSTLLRSRLNSSAVSYTDTKSDADALMSVSYILSGSIFSIDASVRSVDGKNIAEAYVQGKNQDEFITAISTLAEKITAKLAAANTASKGYSVAVTQKPQPLSPTDIAKPETEPVVNLPKWVNSRLKAPYNLMAVKLNRTGARDLFLADKRYVAWYRTDNDIRLLQEIELPPSDKIISIDVYLDNLCLTVVRNDELSSQIWRIEGEKLVKVVANLPWYFRGAALGGGEKKLYVQGMGRDTDFYGEVYEALITGAGIKLLDSIKIPPKSNIYSFDFIKDKDGSRLTVAVNAGSYLDVYDRDMKLIWTSSEKYCVTELFFQKEDLDAARTTGSPYRWIFLNQKLTVTADNQLLATRNEPATLIGYSRTYKQGSIFNLFWNGSALVEKWHTKESPNYVADYFYDSAAKEIVTLEAVQREGIFSKGASAVGLKKLQ